MTQHLFKAKRKDNGEWVEGCFYWDETGTYIKRPDRRTRFGIGIPVIPETVCQWIGSVDQYGNRIWENDLIEIEWDFDDEITVERITYDNKYGYWKYGNNPLCELKDPDRPITVLQSFHDTPTTKE